MTFNVTQKNNPIKYCRECNCELEIGTNWTEYNKRISNYLCKSCDNKRCNAWKKANPENAKVSARKSYDKYKGTPEGKLYSRKGKARRRGYGLIELFDNPFPKGIPVIGHHISDGFVVYLPRSLHMNHLHGKYKEIHRNELKPYVESVYNITYIIEDR